MLHLRAAPHASCVLFWVFAAPAFAQETLTISRLAVPFGANDRASCASVSEDGALMVFQSRRPDGNGGADLWFSRKENGKWSVPYNAGPSINTSANEVDGKLSPDGRTIVFIRGEDFKESSAVYISHFRAGHWTTAEKIPEPVSVPGATQFGAVLTRAGERLYFGSNRPGGLGGFDVYYSDRNGDKWGPPANLGSPINTSGDDADIALSPDGKTMILPRRQPGGLGGVDLYISHREENGWSPLVNLGPRINTPGNDACPWLGYDGKTLYFNSDWEGLVAGRQSKSSAIMLVQYSPGF